MQFRNRIVEAIALWLVALGFSLVAVDRAFAQGYRIERIASGLNQPTYVTQAPNDPANILYYTERTLNANPGFGANNVMGRVWRYDVDTRTKTQVLDLSTRSVTNDTGLQTIAFHPDFNTPATAGFGKMYLSSAQSGGTALNRVEEYTVNLAGPNPTYAATLSRLLLQYQNNRENNHTVDWIGFDPTATGDARNYLYISTGDGSFGNPYNAGTSPTGRPSQNPNDIAGKMLRVDVAGPDAYPANALKNYAIPTSNPLPTYNAANPGSPISGLGEAYLTGLRNVYRASFDRANGDLWMGDVGEVFVEEVSFLKAGTNVSGPPADLGWPQREGTLGSDVPGAPESLVNPFTAVTALQPLQQFVHDGGGEAVIGGYVYRGPVAELQGKYFYSDFVTTGNANQIWMLEFDRNTPTANYNGNNGTRTDVSALWQSLVFDRNDPLYVPNSTTGSSAGLDHIVSFGEDNAGNVYLVDFGNGAGFNGQYPGAGLGEIFRIVPDLQFTVTVDRDTGGLVVANDTGAIAEIRGYTLRSAAGSLERNALTPITGRLDAPPGGDGSIDPNNAWAISSDPGDRHEFSEASTGGAASLSIDEQFVLSPDEGWIPSIYEDLQLSVVLGNGTEIPALVEYIGNGGQPFDRSDLNFNGLLDPADWPIFRSHHLQSFSTLTRAESYHMGDLDGDGDNDFADFRLFQVDYIAANGAAAFDELLHVPEPATALLALSLFGAATLFFRRRKSYLACRPVRAESQCAATEFVVVATTASYGRLAGNRIFCQLPTRLRVSLATVVATFVIFPASADAALKHRYSFTSNINDSVGGANGTVVDAGTTPNFNFTGGRLDLSANSGQGSNAITEDAYVDLPNGIFSSAVTSGTNGAISLEFWATVSTQRTWQRFGDFGTSNGGENMSPGGANTQYVMITPNSGRFNNGLEITNHPASNVAEPSIGQAGPFPLGTEQHVVAVYDHTNKSGGANPNGTMTLYRNGVLIGSNAIHPDVNLAMPIDNNNWLGRSQWNDPLFDGSFNEFRIYDEALSTEQVAANTVAGPDVISVLGIVSLEVNTVTGSVRIRNSVAMPISIDYYTIASAAGALNTAGWTSLADQNLNPVGPGEGESWDEADQSDEFALAELFLLGSSSVSSTSPLQLGHAFDASQFGPGMNGDLQFRYARPGGGLVNAMVTYVTPGPLTGDYNEDGSVDAADYVVWRDTLGSTTMLTADGDADGDVDQHDYTIWRRTFGNMAAAAAHAASSVPEPVSPFLMIATSFIYARILGIRDRSKRN